MWLRAIVLAVCGMGLWAVPVAACAQTLLRWKLADGDALVVEMQQTTNSEVAFSGKSAKNQIKLGMELLWKVTGSDKDAIRIKQSIQRITFELVTDKPELTYDSADKARPTGRAREIASAVKPLLGAEIELTMDNRGLISQTKPLNAAAQALLEAQTADESPSVFSRQAVQTLLRQPLVILPEKAVSMDETWTDEVRELKAAAGTFQQTMTYRLVQPIERDGESVEVIELAGKLEQPTAGDKALKAAAASPLKLKSHEHLGKVLFSTERGRLVSAEQTQKLVTERPYRETTIVVTLESAQSATIRPAGQKETAPP